MFPDRNGMAGDILRHALEDKETDGPRGSEERSGAETVSSTPNAGNCIEAQRVVDAGADVGPGHWVGDGSDIRFIPDKK